MTAAARAHVQALGAFVAAAPSSFHAAGETAARLEALGFRRQDESEPFDARPGGHVLVRGGAVLAWRVPARSGPRTAFRVVGAHTDSPGFVLKPNPDFSNAGWQQLGVEVYGGPLLNSWLDRELGLAGRLALADGTTRLVRTPPLLRIPQLAIHLDRQVNDGLKLDRQQHTAPVWSVGSPDRSILDVLAAEAGCRSADVLGYDIATFVTQELGFFGAEEEFFACGRLDNLSSVFAGLTAMTETVDSPYVTVLAAFDHEEIGSGSPAGAAGPVLADLLERITISLGGGREDHLRALAGSVCLSSDAGHAVHPNYAGRHDPLNRPLLNGGPLLKINANQRYATDAVGAARWAQACAAAGVETQPFVSNNEIPCGSTIGPLTATRVGMSTIDVGPPLLSMHSAREMAGVEDQLALARAIGAFLQR